MKIKLLSGIAIVGLALVFTGCQKYPQAEVDAANAAIESTKAVQANLYVPEEFNALQDSLTTVLAAVEKEKSKLFHNYKDEVAKLTATAEQAKVVAANAQAKKEQYKQETAAALAEITTLMEQNKEYLAKAPKGKEGKAAVEAIGQEIAAVETVSTEVAAGLTNNDDILTLSDKIKPAVEKAKAINTELTDVIAKVKGGKKK